MDNEIIDLDDKLGTGSAAMPNATAVLVLGIISIATCWLYGVPGLICGIIALALFKKDNALYKANPSKYSESSYKNLKAGQVCAIIGLSLSALFFLYFLFVIVLFGSIFATAASSGVFENLEQYNNN